MARRGLGGKRGIHFKGVLAAACKDTSLSTLMKYQLSLVAGSALPCK